MWSMDFSDLTPDDIEAGANVPAGWYRCEVADVSDNPRVPGIVDFKFKVVSGPHKGSVIEDSLFPPDHAKTVESSKKLLQRVAMYATRLGLCTKEELAGNQVDLDWSELVGTPCYVKAVVETYQKKDGGGQGERTKPAFDGVFGVDDERVPDSVRGVPASAAANGNAPAPSANGKGTKGKDDKPAEKPAKAAKKPKETFDDL